MGRAPKRLTRESKPAEAGRRAEPAEAGRRVEPAGAGRKSEPADAPLGFPAAVGVASSPLAVVAPSPADGEPGVEM